MSYIVMKQEILFIMHMPPPVHGAAMVGQYIHDSKLINDKFDSHYINLTTAKSLQDIGKGGIKKLWKFVCLLARIVKSLFSIHPQMVYVTPNSHGGAFYKDFVVVELIKLLGYKVIVHYHNRGLLVKTNGLMISYIVYSSRILRSFYWLMHYIRTLRSMLREKMSLFVLMVFQHH